MLQKFMEQMDQLTDDTEAMGQLASGMLTDAVRALKKRDCELAQSVLDRKDRLANMDDSIEELALRVLTLHQPVAKDLRKLACILKLITYQKRIGRYGYDIAKVAKDICDQPHVAKLVEIPHMAEKASAMITDALHAFRSGDVSGLADFTERDDDLDQMRYSIFRESLTYMMEDPKNITRCMHYIMIARYLERCGDHACKMAEKIHYMVTGERVEIS